MRSEVFTEGEQPTRETKTSGRKTVKTQEKLHSQSVKITEEWEKLQSQQREIKLQQGELSRQKMNQEIREQDFDRK